MERGRERKKRGERDGEIRRTEGTKVTHFFLSPFFHFLFFFRIQKEKRTRTNSLQRYLTNPSDGAAARKHCLHMLTPYLRTSPQWLPQTRQVRPPFEWSLLCEFQTSAWPILFGFEV